MLNRLEEFQAQVCDQSDLDDDEKGLYYDKGVSSMDGGGHPPMAETIHRRQRLLLDGEVSSMDGGDYPQVAETDGGDHQ